MKKLKLILVTLIAILTFTSFIYASSFQMTTEPDGTTVYYIDGNVVSESEFCKALGYDSIENFINATGGNDSDNSANIEDLEQKYIEQGYVKLNSYDEALNYFYEMAKNMTIEAKVMGNMIDLNNAFVDVQKITNRLYHPDYVYLDNGYFNWVLGGISIGIGKFCENGVMYAEDMVAATFGFSYDSTYDEEMQARSVANQIAATYNYGSTYDKIKNVYDYLCTNVTYDYSCTNVTHDYSNRTISLYDTLVNHLAVCDGYARAFKYIMDDLGIPCTIECGADHAWNTVELNGAWYIIDCTNGYAREDGYIRYWFGYFLGGNENEYASLTLQPIGAAYPDIPVTYSVVNGTVVAFDANGKGMLRTENQQIPVSKEDKGYDSNGVAIEGDAVIVDSNSVVDNSASIGVSDVVKETTGESSETPNETTNDNTDEKTKVNDTIKNTETKTTQSATQKAEETADKSVEKSNLNIVPIVIGIVLLVLVVGTVMFIIAKKKKNNNN